MTVKFHQLEQEITSRNGWSVVEVMRNRMIEGISSSGVFDARGKQGALPAQIQRLSGRGLLVGPVRTAWCDEGSVSGLVSCFEECQPGDVIVLQGSGDWAYFGELTGAEAIRRGVVGVVADCYVRDLSNLKDWPIQVFARGLTPKGAGFKEPGKAGVPLKVGPVTVYPGDWIVGDRDGLVVIPAGEVDSVVSDTIDLVAREGRWAADVLRGVSLLDQRFEDGAALRDRLDGAL